MISFVDDLEHDAASEFSRSTTKGAKSQRLGLPPGCIHDEKIPLAAGIDKVTKCDGGNDQTKRGTGHDVPADDCVDVLYADADNLDAEQERIAEDRLSEKMAKYFTQ